MEVKFVFLFFIIIILQIFVNFFMNVSFIVEGRVYLEDETLWGFHWQGGFIFNISSVRLTQMMPELNGSFYFSVSGVSAQFSPAGIVRSASVYP